MKRRPSRWGWLAEFLRTLPFAFALAAGAGCATVKEAIQNTFYDKIEYGLPKLVKPLRAPAAVYLVRPLGAPRQDLYDRNAESLVTAFRRAFETHGERTVIDTTAGNDFRGALAEARAASCDYLVMMRITRWEYGSAGFSGPGGRDDVDFDVLVADVTTGFVLSRASIGISNGFGRSAPGGTDAQDASAPVITRYVNHLFNP